MTLENINKELLSFVILILLSSCLNNYPKLFENSVGTYKVNFSSSDTNFTKAEKQYYRNCKIVLEDDGTFHFIGHPPPGSISQGRWKIETSLDAPPLIGLFNNCGKEYYQISPCYNKNSCSFAIFVPFYVDNIKSGYRNMIFTKQNLN